jgi:cytochrome c oxidase accessory protein FixG
MSTMRDDGSRRWMYPRRSPGRFWHARRVLAYFLIAVFTLVPYIHVGGKPLVLLDIPARQFTILGFTFLPTDTVLLALLMVSGILGIALVTALLGRVWCGWMCPQTVYMEFLYRPIERLFDGPPGIRHTPGKKSSPLRKVLKYVVYLLFSAFLAHTFLAYFVGVKSLAVWVTRSPLEHPAAFLLMVGVTGLMMFDFSYFREQVCLVACPYGRFQSVMLDRDSLIVIYDPKRGEPRAKGRREEGDGLGDCVDCGMCTDTCPTGIDIRDGLQMECVNCTQCIDACDSMMERLGKPRGLIRFSSQARIAGESSRFLRPRVIRP